MIVLTFSKYQPDTICSACGSLVTKYVEHCILWCHANAGARHRMWVWFWHKYGIDLYLRLAGLTHDLLIRGLFKNYADWCYRVKTVRYPVIKFIWLPRAMFRLSTLKT